MGIPLIPHLGYKELTPLGQAEWIKVVGLLTGHSGEANRIFSGIERRYMALKARTDSVKERPRVFTGEMRGGNWYAVGGRSFLAQMFRGVERQRPAICGFRGLEKRRRDILQYEGGPVL